METKRAAAAALFRIGAIEREQIRVREQRQVDRGSGGVAGINRLNRPLLNPTLLRRSSLQPAIEFGNA